MRQTLLILLLTYLTSNGVSALEEEESARGGKVLSVFNVVKFPNDACAANNGFNGTCFTAEECTTKGGTASGTCASSFGVCCVFSIACGGSTSANNSYALINSYSTSSDADPCTYTFCKTSSDVCKLRIDFDTMVLSPPSGLSTPAAYTDGANFGHCQTDSLTVSNPGGSQPPTICGYNTGQHMWLTASDQCNQINIDIDTGSTSTTRKWQIKVTQYECGNLMAPEQDCLQYHTSATGKIASFNWDTSASTVASTQYHLANQYYDICIRRARGYCSVCYDPAIIGATGTAASSYGLGSSGDPTGAAMINAHNSVCLGITTINPTYSSGLANGDYLEIAALQPGTGTATTVLGTAAAGGGSNRICGVWWNVGASVAATPEQVTHATACSFAVPFRVGVHLDAHEAFADNPGTLPTDNLEKWENNAITATSSGYGYSGFYLNYWQNTC